MKLKDLLLEGQVNFADPRSVERYVEKVIEDNYSEEELSERGAADVQRKIAELVKDGEITDLGGLIDAVHEYAKKLG